MLAEEATEQSGEEDDHQVEHDRKPSHVEPTDQAHDDEHGLRGEVRADRRHQPVAEGEPDALHPCRAAGAEQEPDHRAEVEPDRQRRVVAAVGGPPAGDRERHGEHEGDHRPGADGVPVPALASRPGAGGSPNGEGRPSLPGLRMPSGSSAAFTATSTRWASPSASPMNRARLRPTPWWCERLPPLASTAPLAGIPQGDVGRLDLLGGRRGGEREVEAGAVAIAVREVAAGDTRVGDGHQAPRARRRTARRAATTARRSPSCRPRTPCASAPAAPRCRCDARARRRPARRPPARLRRRQRRRRPSWRRRSPARPRRAPATCCGSRRRRGHARTRLRRRAAAPPASPRCAGPSGRPRCRRRTWRTSTPPAAPRAAVGCARNHTRVITPSVPSDPVNSWVRSGPTAAAGAPPVRIDRPSASTTSRPTTMSSILPYRVEYCPAPRQATQPPTVAMSKLCGKWPTDRPCRACSSSSRSGPNVPASTSTTPDVGVDVADAGERGQVEHDATEHGDGRAADAAAAAGGGDRHAVGGADPHDRGDLVDRRRPDGDRAPAAGTSPASDQCIASGHQSRLALGHRRVRRRRPR